MENFTARVYAKVNLSLAVTGKRGNLHTLDMIVCPYRKFYDEAVFTPIEGAKNIEVEQINASFSAFKPRLFSDFFNGKLQIISERLNVGGTVRIQKGVPLGAGLGGSSASVVAVLKAVLEHLAKKGERPSLEDEFLLSLGSDVPCMLDGGVCRVQGVGEFVTPLDCPVPELSAVNIEEGGSDTAKCYAEFDESNDGQYDGLSLADSVEAAIAFPRNDLTQAAVKLNPKIGELIERMQKEYRFALMSGSGSAVVGIN